jgi:hypothetical protein
LLCTTHYKAELSPNGYVVKKTTVVAVNKSNFTFDMLIKLDKV